MPEATYDLQSNTQLTYDGLRIGMAGIAVEDFVDAAGSNQHGLRAGLWLYYRDDPDQDCAVRVQAGESLALAGYQIDVLDINSDQPGTVKLRLTQEPEPSLAT